MYSRLSPIPSFRKYQADGDGGELMKKVDTSAKETRLKKLGHCVASTSEEKTSQVRLYYASEIFIPDLRLGINNK